MNRFLEAVALADELHADQRRKATGVPYISHVLQVCGLVLEDRGDTDEAVAAILHDTVEDQGGVETLALIRARFGNSVADIVAGCSDDMPSPTEAKLPWRQRKEAYLAHLRITDESVLKVSLADRLHNGRSLLADLAMLGPELWQHFDAPPEEQAWLFESSLAVYEERAPGSWNLPAFREVAAEVSRAARSAAGQGGSGARPDR
jgi:(p)ppGpp synthase/HD superfamily hydrolase